MSKWALKMGTTDRRNKERGVTRTYAPFTPSVYDTVAKHKTTVPTNEVSATKLLDNIRIRVSAFRADEANGEVGPK